jgi:DNA invertase Pin-like site-specific DNA recombinase
MSEARVYSYLRFSDAKQATGGSIDRQETNAKRWAEENGLTLDESLTMRDEGLSAYHQKHVKSGALGLFLEAVNAGKIPSGSVLVVEALDRLSRAKPRVAQTQLTQIVDAGLIVVTANDGKQYSQKSLDDNPMEMIYSLLQMIRANEESDSKSKRVKAAIRRQCENWVSGKRRERIVNGRDPGWVRWNGTAFELIPERAEGMRMVIKLFLEGHGYVRIAKELDKHGLVVTGKNATGWIYMLIQRPDLIGVRLLKADGEQYRLENYYPRLISDDDFALLQLEYARRRLKPGEVGRKGKFPSIFTGTEVGTCGCCGRKLVTQNQTRRVRADGTPAIYRRLKCGECESTMGSGRGSIAAQFVEKSILDYCSDQMNLESLYSTGNDQTIALRSEKAAIATKIADLTRMVQNTLDAALSDPSGIPQAMITRMKEMEQQIAIAKTREQQLDAELMVIGKTGGKTTAAQWAEIKRDVLALDYDARLKFRRLLSETFETVQVFFKGTALNMPEHALIMLISKNGVSRLLTIDRKTGGMLEGVTAEIVTDNDVVTVAKVTRLPTKH